MNSSLLMNTRRLSVADKTADIVYNMFNIDRGRAIDTYDIAKKIGLHSNLESANFVDFKKIRNNNSQTANNDRFFLAKAVAKYIIISAFPNADLDSEEIKSTVDALALSLVIPKNEAKKIYRDLQSKKSSEDFIVSNLATLYGVDSEVAARRLNQIKLEEDLKGVPQK